MMFKAAPPSFRSQVSSFLYLFFHGAFYCGSRQRVDSDEQAKR
jgi:hypothetical protein